MTSTEFFQIMDDGGYYFNDVVPKNLKVDLKPTKPFLMIEDEKQGRKKFHKKMVLFFVYNFAHLITSQYKKYKKQYLW